MQLSRVYYGCTPRQPCAQRGRRPCRVFGVASAPRQSPANKPQPKIKGIIEVSGRNTRHFGSAIDQKDNPQHASHSSGHTGSDIRENTVDFIKGLFLPVGYPDTVSPDYLAYQLWAVPSHITGWLGGSLITSSLLAAVGIKAGAGQAAGAAASIRWITKDGIGALGRLLVSAGRVGAVFDEDPKRWRLIAEGFTTAGRALEIATAIFPQNFVILAGLGNFTKALGKGMGSPCFRIFQTHFAKASNVGDVAAKEQVWEVTAQLTGLVLSIALLNAIEATGDPTNAVWAWVAIHSVHVGLRFKSLSVIQLPTLNQKRSCALVNAYVQGQRLPDVQQGNAEETIIAGPASCSPRLEFGCAVHKVFADSEAQELLELANIFAQENFILVWQGSKGTVLLKETAVGQDNLRALLQAAWLANDQVQDATHDQLRQSLERMQGSFSSFIDAAGQAGWHTDRVVIQTKQHRFKIPHQ